MPALEWSDALSLDLPLMDDTHRKFVVLLATVSNAPDTALVSAWSGLIDHTQTHFGREDGWMAQTRFASSNCHSVQHKVILQVMREGLAAGRAGDLDSVRLMAGELAIWFPIHAQTMDAALALHLRRTGFDPDTGMVHAPDALPDTLMQGCAGQGCAGQGCSKTGTEAAPESGPESLAHAA